MTAEVDVANRALSAVSTRSSIASLNEGSNESIEVTKHIDAVRDEILRMAPWNCATNFNNLALICAAPGTPENPTVTAQQWAKGQPAPPWAYEYAYPSDCLRPLFIVPQFTTGFGSGIPLTTLTAGGAPQFWSGPPIRFKVSIDQITNGVPAVGGADTRVILTNQENAILCYLKQVTDPNVMDPQFIQAWVAGLAARICIPLTGDKALAQQKVGEANQFIQIARTGDGNEGLTVNDVTPDWIRTRGINGPVDFGWSPNMVFDWGGLFCL